MFITVYKHKKILSHEYFFLFKFTYLRTYYAYIYTITDKCYNLTFEIQISVYGITSKNSKRIETIFYTDLIKYDDEL